MSARHAVTADAPVAPVQVEPADDTQIRIRLTAHAVGASAFRPGDVLTLRTGGHAMTATWVGPVAFAPGIWLICQWFDRTGTPRQDMFPESTLALAIDTLASSQKTYHA